MDSSISCFNPLPSDCIPRCEGILRLLQGATLSNKIDEKTIVDKARTDLRRISSEMSIAPKLMVAVYGDTGSGKSSMLNALLDQPSLVPTAGMGRACTSVVISIEENTLNTNFEADVEFLTKEEWEKEINLLTKDLKDEDDGSEYDDDVYDSARALVTAVYGEFEDEDLQKVIETETEITQNLGSTLQLSDTDTRSLQDKIWQYIATTDEGFQHWPIVKQVTLRVPNSDLCKSGTELIDLPGVGDSNPARDSVASKYKHTCDVLMIVTKIQRAIDNKTARNVLGDTMYRQVQMDHRRTVLACTQTDDIKPAEVIRKFKLPQAGKWTEENQESTEEEKQLERRLTQLRMAMQNKMSTEDRASLNEKETECYRKLDLVRGKIKQLKREKSSTCAVERNTYVKRAILNKTSSSDNSATDMEVFCVSSADYIKLSKLQTSDDDDDKPAVFVSADQTEIPALRNFLKATAKEKQDRKSNSIRRDIKMMISGLMTYISNSELGGKTIKKALEQTLSTSLTGMVGQIENVVMETEKYIQELYEKHLYLVLEEAAISAESHAKPTSDNWARQVNRRHRQRGGLAFRTYKATVQRYGLFTSQGMGYKISMNEDLTDPFLRTISPPWQDMFSEDIWDDIIWKRIRDPVNNIITNCSNEILKSVQSQGFDVSPLSFTLTQLKTDTVDKLTRLDTVYTVVQRQQREITYYIPGHVQAAMKDTYDLCMKKDGPGSFQDMKTIMALRVDQLKATMFRDIKETVIRQLDSLKDDVIGQVKHILDDICEDYKKQIEPLWQTHGGAEFFKNVKVCKEELRKLLTEIKEFEEKNGEDLCKATVSGRLSGKRKIDDTNSAVCIDKSKALRQM